MGCHHGVVGIGHSLPSERRMDELGCSLRGANMHCDRWFAWSTGPVALPQSDITNRQSISSRGVQTYVGRVKIPPFFRAPIGRYLSSLSCGGVQARRWKRNFAPRGKPPPNAPKRRRETAPVASADAPKRPFFSSGRLPFCQATIGWFLAAAPRCWRPKCKNEPRGWKPD